MAMGGVLQHLLISIHALREEGDIEDEQTLLCYGLFLSTPSARRATDSEMRNAGRREDFYPRPPRGGRPELAADRKNSLIHFYPRPPRGGRHRP